MEVEQNRRPDRTEELTEPIKIVPVVHEVCDESDPSAPSAASLSENIPQNEPVDIVNDGALSPDRETGTATQGSDKPKINPPVVGYVAEKWEDIEVLYRKYGEQQGFGISRVQSANRGKKGGPKTKRCITWKCDCYGKPYVPKRLKKSDGEAGEDIVEPQPSIYSKKVGCKAQVYAVSDKKDGSWSIKKVILEHVHPMSPSRSKSIKQHRPVLPHVRKKLFSDFSAGISVPQFHNALAAERNGYEDIPTERDLRNIVAEQKKLILKEGDANAMEKYFERMQEDNQNFFHRIRLEDDGTLKDVLWVDARSRAAYEEFGDVVCFDTTYLTNAYDLPFANFVGVNHHGQTILLGCALISRETSETFEWVFKTWLTCMGGKAPQGILTDQATAIRNGIAAAMPMPATRHRWCLWHIVKKFKVKLGNICGYDEFGPMLKNAIYDSFCPTEFEKRWKLLIAQFDLSHNEWLDGLYKEREMWVPAYTKHMFWAGMRSTQRVESIHSFFDKFGITSHTRLYEFVEKYCRSLEKRALVEKEADDKNYRKHRGLSSSFIVEKIFQTLYTDAKFREVQLQCDGVRYCNSRGEKAISDSEVEFLMQDRVWVHVEGCRECKVTNSKRLYKVIYNKDTNEVRCECKHFECNGILCRHCINVYEINCVTSIPDKYIVRRWRKDIARKHTRVKVAYHDPSKTEEVMRYDAMHVVFEPLAVQAMECENGKELVVDVLRQLKDQLEELMGKQLVPLVDDEPIPTDILGTDMSGVGNNNFIGEHSNINHEDSTVEMSGVAPDLNITPQSVGCSDNENVRIPPKDPISSNTRGGKRRNRWKAFEEQFIPSKSARTRSNWTQDDIQMPLHGSTGTARGRGGRARGTIGGGRRTRGSGRLTKACLNTTSGSFHSNREVFECPLPLYNQSPPLPQIPVTRSQTQRTVTTFLRSDTLVPRTSQPSTNLSLSIGNEI